MIATNDRQCKTNQDCVDQQLGGLCVDQVCEPDTSSVCLGPACMMGPDAAVPPDDSCTNDAQCRAESTPRCMHGTCVSREIAERWMCAVEDQTIRTRTVRYSFHIVDFLTREPPKDVVVHACRNNDVACEQPVATFTDTDATGHAQFDLPAGFLGFFDIKSDAVPSLLYVTKPIVKNTLNRDLPVLSWDTVDITAMYAGFTFQRDKGLALLEALDCSDTPAGGVQFTVTGGARDQFYLVDQVPSTDARVTSYDSSNNTANGGFINVPPGFVTFSAYLGLDGPELGSFNAQIRAGTITFIDMDF